MLKSSLLPRVCFSIALLLAQLPSEQAKASNGAFLSPNDLVFKERLANEGPELIELQAAVLIKVKDQDFVVNRALFA